jgi:hypothetical protein
LLDLGLDFAFCQLDDLANGFAGPRFGKSTCKNKLPFRQIDLPNGFAGLDLLGKLICQNNLDLSKRFRFGDLENRFGNLIWPDLDLAKLFAKMI